MCSCMRLPAQEINLMWENYELSVVSTARHCTCGDKQKSVLNKIPNSILIDMQLAFEEDFDIWHVYKYSIVTLLLENHLIMEIPITDWDMTIKLLWVYDIPVPVSDNDTASAEIGILCNMI